MSTKFKFAALVVISILVFQLRESDRINIVQNSYEKYVEFGDISCVLFLYPIFATFIHPFLTLFTSFMQLPPLLHASATFRNFVVHLSPILITFQNSCQIFTTIGHIPPFYTTLAYI